METWGRISLSFEALLRDLAALASRRQRERGMQPTKWIAKWQTQLSLSVTIHVGRCLLDALPNDIQRRHSFGKSALIAVLTSWTVLRVSPLEVSLSWTETDDPVCRLRSDDPP